MRRIEFRQGKASMGTNRCVFLRLDLPKWLWFAFRFPHTTKRGTLKKDALMAFSLNLQVIDLEQLSGR